MPDEPLYNAGICCQNCGCRDLRVDRTMRTGNIIRRYRHCRYCGKKMITTERVEIKKENPNEQKEII